MQCVQCISGIKFFKGKGAEAKMNFRLFFSHSFKNESVDLLRKGERENMSKKTVWTV